LDEENALKEVVQEIILFALWRADFFDVAAFQGGTSLRILHGLNRFSEDMGFILLQPDSEFAWQFYLERLAESCREFGLEPELVDRNNMDKNVKAALIKNASIARQLNLEFYNSQGGRKLTIELEIDCNPPAGSILDYSYLDFPMDFEVCHQDLKSNFSLKLHALLCRPYQKGRDWYDFSWYVAQNVSPNMTLLTNALVQYGPWQGQILRVDREWLMEQLGAKIAGMNWRDVAMDVERFLQPASLKSLELWSERFFSRKLAVLENLMA